MVTAGETVVLGVSGGLDSICLLDILALLRSELRLCLVVAHVHHGLRIEEGEREFQFVQERAREAGAPFEGLRIEASKYEGAGNKQARARRARVRFFEEVALKWGAGRIATGHHRDDHAETLMMQLFRGTGGLIGIRPVRDGRYIRPLIELSREEIRNYARDRGLSFCEDSSNRKRTYLRNRVRQDFIPWIQREANPSFVESLLQLASIQQEESRYLDRVAEEALDRATMRAAQDGDLILGRDPMEGLPRAIQRRVLRQAYGRLDGSTRGLSYTHLEGVCDALGMQKDRTHKVFSLPRGVRLFVEYDAIYLTRRELWKVAPYEIPLPLGGEREVPQAGIVLRVDRVFPGAACPEGKKGRDFACLDADLARGAMVVRNVRPGDRFQPAGLGGEKKIKDFFIDEKIPRSLRRRIAILEVGGRVAWVVGYRIDERFRVSDATGSMIRLQVISQGRSCGTCAGKMSQIK